VLVPKGDKQHQDDIIVQESSAMTSDEWRLLGYGMLTAVLMALVLVPILLHNKNFPRLVAEGILGAVALAVFALSKYMERRKKPN
jgi:hypothetical protein